MNYNRVVLVGRMVRDPELRQVADDKRVARFTVAVNRPVSKDSQERVADFFNAVSFGATADFLQNYASKGRLVLVEGRLQTRQYNDREGVVRRTVEVLADRVLLLDSSKSQSSSESGSGDGVNEQAADAKGSDSVVDDDFEYDPFL